MEKKNYLSGLLKKYREGSISKEELKELDELLNKGDQSDLKEIIDAEWKNSGRFTNEINTRVMLKQISLRAGLSKGTDSQKNIRLFNRLAKIAAIFLFAFGLSFFFQNYFFERSEPSDNNYFKIKVAYGSKSTIELPDGSTVVLNSGSTLSYPARFSKKNRTVYLDGEGFFDISKDKSRPFLVNTNNVLIKVLGTKFNVKSYPDENYTETTLVSGAVEILKKDSKTAGVAKPIFLKPNQKVIITKSETKPGIPVTVAIQKNKTIPKIESKKSDVLIQKEVKTELYTAWKSNVLVFNNDSFYDIIKKLERWYNVEITLDSENLNNVRFSAKFDRESIQQVLNALNLIQPFHYKIDKYKIQIY